jgi:hypothetical protein
MVKPKTPISGRLENNNGERIRASGHRVLSQNPESVPIVRRAPQTLAPTALLPLMQVPGSAGVNQPGETWSPFVGNIAIANLCSSSSLFMWVRPIPFFNLRKQSSKNNIKTLLAWKVRPP